MLEAEQGFACPNCGADTQLFYSNKTWERIAWTCQHCKTRGYFVHQGKLERAVLME